MSIHLKIKRGMAAMPKDCDSQWQLYAHCADSLDPAVKARIGMQRLQYWSQSHLEVA